MTHHLVNRRSLIGSGLALGAAAGVVRGVLHWLPGEGPRRQLEVGARLAPEHEQPLARPH